MPANNAFERTVIHRGFVNQRRAAVQLGRWASQIGESQVERQGNRT